MVPSGRVLWEARGGWRREVVVRGRDVRRRGWGRGWRSRRVGDHGRFCHDAFDFLGGGGFVKPGLAKDVLRPEREEELEVGGVDIAGRDGGREGVSQARHGLGNRCAVGGQVVTLLDAGGEDFRAVPACGTLGAEV